MTPLERVSKVLFGQQCVVRAWGAFLALTLLSSSLLGQAIQRYIEDSVAELIIEGKLKEKQTLTIYLEGDALYYRPKGSQKQGAPLSYTI